MRGLSTLCNLCLGERGRPRNLRGDDEHHLGVRALADGGERPVNSTWRLRSGRGRRGGLQHDMDLREEELRVLVRHRVASAHRPMHTRLRRARRRGGLRYDGGELNAFAHFRSMEVAKVHFGSSYQQCFVALRASGKAETLFTAEARQLSSQAAEKAPHFTSRGWVKGVGGERWSCNAADALAACRARDDINRLPKEPCNTFFFGSA